MLLALIACATKETSRDSGAGINDSLITDSRKRDDSKTSLTPAKRSSGPDTADSELQKPHVILQGNFILTDTILVKGYRLDHLEIDTRDSAGTTLIRYVGLRFYNVKKDDGTSMGVDATFRGTPDAFSMSLFHEALGNIAITGSFLPVKGMTSDEIMSSGTIVFEGRLSADSISDRTFECTYFEGD